MRRKRTIFIGLGAFALVVALVQAGPLMSQVEQPSYVVERSDAQFEVRRYPAMIVAQVKETGARKAAIGNGFRAIAGYIFGSNRPQRKVAMTAPVLQRRDGSGVDGSWTVQFVMPRQWTLATLPKPDDPRVALVPQPAATFAVIRFSGLAGDATIAEKTQALDAFIAKQQLHASGTPVLAFFDPPWTLPFLRRNEIMIEVSPS
jgi:hypothetical protein